MGLFSFIKDILGEKEEEQVVEPKNLGFSDVSGWLDEKEKDIKVSEEEVFDLIGEKIKDFVNEFDEKIGVVKNIDIEKKKAEDRLKSMAMEGRSKYIECADILMKKLYKLDKVSLEKFGADVDKVFSDFNKSSNMSYERATILIGNEMGDVKDSVGGFSKDVVKILEENKTLVNSCNNVSAVRSKLSEINKIEKGFVKIKKELNEFDNKISKHQNQHSRVLDEIDNIKKGDDFVENLKRQEKIKLYGNELDDNIIGLRNVIDFKALGNFFHIFEDQMAVVQAHKNDFRDMFEKDNGAKIIELLNKAGLNKMDISDKVEKIISDKEKIINEKKEVKSDETLGLQIESKNIMQRIESLKDEKNKVGKRREKLEVGKEDLIKNVKEGMEGLGVVVN